MKVAEAARFNRLYDYEPYEKQRIFHALGATKRERALFAGNQLGKTYCGGAEFAYHVTGLYPEWWKGRRFNQPILAWAAGISNEQTRDNAQRVLFGEGLDENFGTGMIPSSCIGNHSLNRGTADFIDKVSVKHVSGGWSTISFKSYEQGRKKWQGAPVPLVWCDEEPPADVYSEAQARTTACNGIIMCTFTPLLGATQVVDYFFPEPKEKAFRAIVRMEIQDAGHIPASRVAEEIAKYPEHEREARTKGIPILGSGRVFPIAESAITIPAMDLPPHWPRIVGLDFGWDHPTAAAWLAVDRDADMVHLYAEYRQREQIVAVHADAVKMRGDWIPVAWPHDGHSHEKGTGVPLAHQYRAKGVKMLPEQASFAGGKWSTPEKSRSEAGVSEMLTMMKEGRFKVHDTCTMWLEEFRLHHRRDGRIVAKKDDLISASRYAVMMRRFAREKQSQASRLTRHEAGAYDPLMH